MVRRQIADEPDAATNEAPFLENNRRSPEMSAAFCASQARYHPSTNSAACADATQLPPKSTPLVSLAIAPLAQQSLLNKTGDGDMFSLGRIAVGLVALASVSPTVPPDRIYGLPETCDFFANGGTMVDVLRAKEDRDELFALDDVGILYPGTVCLFRKIAGPVGSYEVDCQTAGLSSEPLIPHRPPEQIRVIRRDAVATIVSPDETTLDLQRCR